MVSGIKNNKVDNFEVILLKKFGVYYYFKVWKFYFFYFWRFYVLVVNVFVFNFRNIR